MDFKDIESVQEFLKERLNSFEKKIDKSILPENENESYEASITIKITFRKGTYRFNESLKTKHTERKRSK